MPEKTPVGGMTMKIRLIAIVLVFMIGAALCASLVGCKDEGKDASDAWPLLFMGGNQGYFPEIPKGVAQ